MIDWRSGEGAVKEEWYCLIGHDCSHPDTINLLQSCLLISDRFECLWLPLFWLIQHCSYCIGWLPMPLHALDLDLVFSLFLFVVTSEPTPWSYPPDSMSFHAAEKGTLLCTIMKGDYGNLNHKYLVGACLKQWIQYAIS